MFKVIIAGGRDFQDYDTLCRICDFMLQNKSEVEVVCGMARGADLLGKKYALERGLKVAEFPADWESHGKKAGPIRNKQMAEYANALIAFWDGKSSGTANMISLARKMELPLKVHNY